MFWGIVLENGKRYTQVVDDGFHISMAALEPQLDKKGKANIDSPVSVMMEREQTEFLLCSLTHEKRPQQALDLNFAEGEAVTLFLNGTGIVHLTGYVVEDMDEQDSYGEEDEDEDISDAESEDLEALHKEEDKAIKRKSQKAIEMPNKKPKMSTSDDESDEDLSSLDEEFSMDDSDDEDDNELMLKYNKQSQNQQSPKKSAIKAVAVGAPYNNKQSPSPPKKVTIAATPKSAAKPNAGPKTPATSEKQNQKQKTGPQTPAANGNKSPNESLSESAKKRRKRNKKKSLGSPDAASPVKANEKTPGKGQNNAEKTPGKGQSKVEKTPGKGQNNAEKTPAKVQKKLPGGVVLEDLRVGNGPEAKQGKMVQVHYVGKLTNNKEFDSSVKGQKPFKFRLGKNEVIKGWDVGIEGMKVGGRRKLMIPPNQGYGSKHMGTIPPNSTLNFEVELVSVS